MNERWTAEQYRSYVEGRKKPGKGKTRTGEQPTENRKVRGARVTVRDGIKFASRLESYMHSLLTMYRIPFEFQKKYTLQEKTKYNGETLRCITYTIDFELPAPYDVIIDTKGVTTQQGAMRIKMLKKTLSEQGRATRIELPRTQDECAALVRRLLDEKNQYDVKR
ncbi:MAG: DUF1064 domain-containing protein [Alistipes sp.]|nr:DUF1064 domain-containing protein [Alistipes sp.]